MAIENPFKKMPKPAVYASVGGFILIAAIVEWRHHSETGSWNPWSGGASSAASASGTTTASTGSADGTDLLDGSDGNAEPASPQEDLATQSQGGSGYASNALWAQAVQAGLTSVGYNSEAVAQALGAFQAQVILSGSEATIMRVALAEYGPPPTGNLQILTAPSGGTDGSGSGSSPSVSVSPKSAPESLSVTPYPGNPGKADFGWASVTGANNYELDVKGAGGKGTGTSSVDRQEDANAIEDVTLNPGDYVARVRARNATGYGPWTAEKPFTIARAASKAAPPLSNRGTNHG